MKIANSLNVGGAGRSGVELIGRMAAAGFDGLDLNYYEFCCRPEWQDPESAASEIEALARAASQAGLEWVQAHAPFAAGATDPPRDARLLEGCARAVGVCGRLGARWLVVHPFWSEGAWDRAHRRRLLEANVEFMRALLDRSEAEGVGLALENVYDPRLPHARVFGSAPEDLCELVELADHPLVGVCWDTGHAHVAKLDQRAAIASLGARLVAVHIHDNDGRDDFHVLPFTTAHMGIDWDAVTLGLAEAGYEGDFTLEAATPLVRMPDGLFDETLALSASTARHLADRVERARAGLSKSPRRA